MKALALTPRDFVLLVRQKANEYSDVLTPAFAATGIHLRNEAGMVGSIPLQDLLVEAVSELIVAVLRLAMTARAGRHWTNCQESLITLWGIAHDDEIAQANLARELDAYVHKLKAKHLNPPKSKTESRLIIDDIIGFIGRERLAAAHPAYEQGDWFEKVLDSAGEHLWASTIGDVKWGATLDIYEGIHAVPLMTIHKSKGLEYHSVIFVGLDDGAWWSFSNDQFEATAGFFVAFTRAKQRVVFTYCAQRGARTNIADLYQLLKHAGVKIVKVA